jgi:integrase
VKTTKPANPMRGIYLRGKVYWLAVQQDRKRQFVTLDTSDPAIAIQKAKLVRKSGKIESGTLLDHAIERFLTHMTERTEAGHRDGWAKATVNSKCYVLRAFAAWAGKIPCDRINEKMLKEYHRQRVKESSAQTAYGNLMTIRSFFNWAKETNLVRANPAIECKFQAPETIGRKDFCTGALAAKLIAECPREDLKFVLFCGFHLGMRFLEIVEAVPWWFDMDRGICHLRKTPTIQFKDREERSVPMTAQMLAFLREYGLREPFMLHPEKLHGPKRPSRSMKGWRYRYDFKRPFNEYMKAQGCPWVTPHTMRHTFASLLASAGVSIYRIAVWMGDDVRVVQKHYAKLVPEPGATDAAFQVSSPSILLTAASTSSLS